MSRTQQVELLGSEQFEKRFGNLFRSVYCGIAARRSSFCNTDWKSVLLRTGLHFDKHNFDAISAGALRVSDSQMILSDIDTLPPHQYARVIFCNWESLDSGCHGTCLYTVNTAVFGSSGHWGAICNPEYTVLAGVDNFMSEYLRIAGGEDRIRERFREYVDWCEGNLPGMHIRERLGDIGWC
jgi:hypothetical protein